MAQRTILIVDDSPTVREIVKDALSEVGYNVVEAADGEEGYNKALEIVPDLILLDLTMPKRDGIDVCADLRNSPEMKNIKIIILTQRDSEFDQMVGKEVGADKYLPKPFDSETLIGEIRELLVD